MSGIFVINGFYASMRDVYCRSDAKIHWYDVEWDTADNEWEAFRGSVLGATDPVTAAPGALRRKIFDSWQSLGLAAEPNVGDNGVHASASPFEAMAERLNWLGAELKSDSFGQALLAAGIPAETILAWTKDPQVALGNGETGSLFDQVEDQSVADCVSTLQKLAGVETKFDASGLKNRAFVFVKPAAFTPAVLELVSAGFAGAKISILAEGDLTGDEISENMYIDNHYLSIATKASLNKPSALNPPAAGLKKFEATFGLTWAAAIAEGRFFNAVDACTLLGVNGDQLNTLWAAAKKNKKLAKLSGGFYAGLLPVLNLPSCIVAPTGTDVSEVKELAFTEDNYQKLINLNGVTLPSTEVTVNGVAMKKYPAISSKFVLNGFYAGMRGKFTDSKAKIHYYTVSFETANSTWEGFRGSILGATDPPTAASGSLRRTIYDTYESLGLESQPNVGDNGVHASASPFEALAERINWLNASLSTDSFGQVLLAAGIPEDTIMAWTVDPQVELKDGSKGSLFDQVEDQSVAECVATLCSLAGVEQKTTEVGPNLAYVFIKPHACVESVQKLVSEKFAEVGITVLSEGEITGPQIEENKFIDNHYYSIASKASLNKPAQLNPPAAGVTKFYNLFGLSWASALDLNSLFNAVDGQAALGMTPDGVDAAWAKCKKDGHLVKLSGGFYAGRLLKIGA